MQSDILNELAKEDVDLSEIEDSALETESYWYKVYKAYDRRVNGFFEGNSESVQIESFTSHQNEFVNKYLVFNSFERAYSLTEWVSMQTGQAINPQNFGPQQKLFNGHQVIYNSQLLQARRDKFSAKTMIQDRLVRVGDSKNQQYLICTGITIPGKVKKERKIKLTGLPSTLQIEVIRTPFLGLVPPFLSKASLNAQNCLAKLKQHEIDILRDLEQYKNSKDADAEFLSH